MGLRVVDMWEFDFMNIPFFINCFFLINCVFHAQSIELCGTSLPRLFVENIVIYDEYLLFLWEYRILGTVE